MNHHPAEPRAGQAHEADQADVLPLAQQQRPRLLSRVLAVPDATGAVFAGWFMAQSLSPSLLARSWLFQGVLAGVAVVVGYWIGKAVGRLARWFWRRTPWADRPSPQNLLRTRWAALTAVALLMVWAVASALPEHRWTWERLGFDRSSLWYVYLASLSLAAVVAALVWTIGSTATWLWRRLTLAGTRVLPARVAGGLALVLLVWAASASLNNVVLTRTIDGFNATFAAGDLDLDAAPAPPPSQFRSGGPASRIGWAEAGHEGRRFLTRGPSTAALADFAQGPVSEPVRVFVGRAQEVDVTQRVALAMDELERFGAFEREAVLVVIPTGTGWINEQIVQPLEYFFDGDVATVGVQYSHMPSPLAFMAEGDAAAAVGRELVAAVEERAAAAEDPPLVYVAGESLGSFGGSHAFTSLADSARRTDGAVWVGPPETMRLRREAEEIRADGSTQVRPVVGDGTEFVFINRASDFEQIPDGAQPHSVFLQQADDPIVWWDWQTAYNEPDWLEEPLDAAVNPHLRWSPLTTFLQLAVDMAVSNDFDEEHGHLYGTLPLTSWHHIVARPGWDQAKVERLRVRLGSVAR